MQLTTYQKRLLIGALGATVPQTAYGLTSDTCGGDRRARVDELVAAGLLSAHDPQTVPREGRRSGRPSRALYLLTSEGERLAQSLFEQELLAEAM